MTDLLITILTMSLVCCGATVISEKGMILYFLRKPLDKLSKRIQEEKDIHMERVLYWEFGIAYNISTIFYNLMNYLSKPIILCCTCMASLWGGATYYLLHGFDLNIIPAILATAFLNSVFINYYYKQA